MNIYETIAAVIAEIPAVGKEKKTQGSNGYNYRGIDDVMNAMQPLFAKHNLFVVPEVLEQKREERQSKNGGLLIYSICKVKYTFYAEDGSSVSAVVIGEAMDSSDKATNKAMSAAFKYCLFQTFCIPTEEMIDSETDTHEAAAQKFICEQCGKDVTGYKTKAGETKTAAEAAAISKSLYKRVLCIDCIKQAAKE